MNKIYKTFLIKTLILMILVPVALVIFGIITGEKVIGTGFIKYGESQVINNWLDVKKNYAKEHKNARKIVFISGSNTLFGIDAKEIEKELKIPTLNYGVHGGLLNYIFYSAKQLLNQGDIVILPLEYNYYTKPNFPDNFISTTIIEYTISYDKGYFDTLNFKDKILVLNYLTKLKTLASIGKVAGAQYVLDKNGDIEDKTGCDENFIKNYKFEPLNFEMDFKDYKSSELYKFIDWCKKNNIKVYSMAPSIYHSQNTTFEEEKFFLEILEFYKLSNVKFLGNFKDGFFEKEYIFNTEYHLNTSGKAKRTKHVLSLIKNEL